MRIAICGFEWHDYYCDESKKNDVFIGIAQQLYKGIVFALHSCGNFWLHQKKKLIYIFFFCYSPSIIYAY